MPIKHLSCPSKWRAWRVLAKALLTLLTPPTKTPFLVHFVTKSGPFGRFGGVHCTPWLQTWEGKRRGGWWKGNIIVKSCFPLFFQYGNYMSAKHLWNELATKHPEVLGKVNPHNDDIKKQFGDQGGHWICKKGGEGWVEGWEGWR